MKANIHMTFLGTINGVAIKNEEEYWGIVNILSWIGTSHLDIDTDDRELTEQIQHTVQIAQSMADYGNINKWYRTVERMIKDSPKEQAKQYIKETFSPWQF